MTSEERKTLERLRDEHREIALHNMAVALSPNAVDRYGCQRVADNHEQRAAALDAALREIDRLAEYEAAHRRAMTEES